MIDLSGKRALVTGGSRGIGRATALMLARAGADVGILYRANEEAAREVVEAGEAMARRMVAARADVSDRQQVERAVKEVREALGGVDILVNNAGVWMGSPVEEISEAEWAQVMDTNLKGCWLCVREVIQGMKATGWGRIINVSSTAGQRGEGGHSHYAASKGGLISFTKSLAVELAPHGILVNCVAPGWVETAMARPALQDLKVREWVLEQIPLRKVATTDDIAGAILFLASDLAGHITGEILNVNGGAVLCG